MHTPLSPGAVQQAAQLCTNLKYSLFLAGIAKCNTHDSATYKVLKCYIDDMSDEVHDFTKILMGASENVTIPKKPTLPDTLEFKPMLCRLAEDMCKVQCLIKDPAVCDALADLVGTIYKIKYKLRFK